MTSETCPQCRINGECARHEFIRLRYEDDLRQRGETVPVDPLAAIAQRVHAYDMAAREQRQRLDDDIAIHEWLADDRARRALPRYPRRLL